MIISPMETTDKQAPDLDYDWIKTAHGDFRIQQSRWGTFTTYARDGKGLVTGLTSQVTTDVTKYYLAELAQETSAKLKLKKSRSRK